MRQRQKGFPRPLLDQVWWRHHQAQIWPAGAMNQHAAESNECLARAALCDNVCIACQLPPLAHAHDGQSLRRIRRTQHMREQWRRCLACTKQRRVRRQNAFADLLTVSSEIIMDSVEVLHGFLREGRVGEMKLEVE